MYVNIRDMYSLEICMYLTCTPSCILTIYMKVTPPLMGVRCFLILYMVSESLGSFPVPNSQQLKHRNIIIETADGYILGSGTDF